MRGLHRALGLGLLLASTAAMASPARDGFTPAVAISGGVPRYAGTDSAALADAVRTMHNEVATKPFHPLQFAVGAEMPLELADGRWDVGGDGTAVWRMRVASAGSTLLGVSFAQLQLPASARMYFYDLAATTVQGPYTAADVGADGSLVSAVVPGAEAIIELHVARADMDRVQLKLGRIYHGFRAFPGARETSALPGKALQPAQGASASCEVDVVCPAGSTWQDPVRSVALIQSANNGGLVFCTGQLVNDLRNDNVPYFLTAHHCEITTTTVASSVVLYWNYQAASCGGTGAIPTQTSNGSSLVETDPTSDTTLIQLNQTPPANYNVYYAGWDVSTSSIPQSGVAIHHPEADVKKISTYDTPASRFNNLPVELSDGSDQVIDVWQVIWSAGITEEGSSGAALWNQDHHVIGVLSGGTTSAASCNAAPPRGTDDFGRLDVGWNTNAASGAQLKHWLDPDNTGLTCVDGRNPGDGAASTSCSPGGGTTTGGTTTGGTTGGTTTGGTTGGGGGGGSGSPFVALMLAPLAWLRHRRARPR